MSSYPQTCTTYAKCSSRSPVSFTRNNNMSKHERGQDDEVESPPVVSHDLIVLNEQKKIRFDEQTDDDQTVEETSPESEDFNATYTSSEQEEEQVIEEHQENHNLAGEEASGT